jgi:hypothetical protein
MVKKSTLCNERRGLQLKTLHTEAATAFGPLREGHCLLSNIYIISSKILDFSRWPAQFQEFSRLQFGV